MTQESLLVIKTDSLGDLMLFEPALRELSAGLPEVRITAVVREAHLELGKMIAPKVEWLGTSIDPLRHGPESCGEALETLRREIRRLNPKTVIAATSRRNWLETVLAADAPAARRLAFTSQDDDVFFTTRLRIDLGIKAAGIFEAVPAPSPEEADWHRGLRLASAALRRGLAATPPVIRPGERGQAGILAKYGLIAGRFAVCAPAGFVNVQLKTWPVERFAPVIAELGSRHGLPTLLIGSHEERPHLEKIQGAAAIWTGGSGELSLLTGLLSEAALYVGNDTGAMHIAAAAGVPVVGIFGGGTWPRFKPAAAHGAAVVHPLPCFSCGWDCAFGQASCLDRITIEDVKEAVSHALGHGSFEVRALDRASKSEKELIAAAARAFQAAQTGHLARQNKLEELVQVAREREREILKKETEINAKEAEINALKRASDERSSSLLAKEREINSKETEIGALKKTCDERENALRNLDGHARQLQAENVLLKADKAVLEKTIGALPTDAASAAAAIADQLVHIRNLEAQRARHESELAEFRRTEANLAAGLHALEGAKYYGKLLAEKESVVQGLARGVRERDRVIAELAAQTSPSLGDLRSLWVVLAMRWQQDVVRPLEAIAHRRLVEADPRQIGVLRHHEPRPLRWDPVLARHAGRKAKGPQIAIVTPSFGQERFLDRTLRSILDQQYPNLLYVVQDGGSKDGSVDIIRRHEGGLHSWVSEKDAGQADAIRRGFARVEKDLEPDDIMAWLNSDDLIAPGSLAFVASYFEANPEVDAIYGHRIIIDEEDGEVGRWVMPRHHPETLEWIDYVPQETLFWRKRAWTRVGGLDPTFQFAMDWDLLARLQQANCRLVRVPYFLGAFRVHNEQKTSQAIHTIGAEEMRRIRERFHGPRHSDHATIDRFARRTRLRGAITARLLALGIRW